MSRKNSVFSICLILLLTQVVFPQTFNSRFYSEHDGLPSSNVTDVAQDSKGNMWFATRNGLAKYDGYKWEIFNQNKIFSTKTYYYIKIDDYDNIWAYGSRGFVSIVKRSGKKWSNLEFNPDFNVGSTYDFQILFDNDKSIYAFSTREGGINICRDGELERYFENDKINSILAYDGGFLFTRKNEVYKIKYGKIDKFFSLDNSIIRKIYRDENNPSKIWVLARNKIVLFNNEKKIFEQSINLPRRVANENYFLFNYNNSIFGGNEAEQFILTDGQIQYFNLAKSIRSDRITSIFKDFENNLWISNPRGVIKIPTLQFLNFKTEDGLLANEVTAIEKNKNGEYIFGHNLGLTIYKDSKFKVVNFNKDNRKIYRNSRVFDIEVDDKGNTIFAAEALGIGILSKYHKLNWLKPDRESGLAFSVNKNSKGEVFALFEKQIYRIIKNKKLVPVKSEFLKYSFPRKLFIDKEDKMWVSSLDGIWTKENNKWILISDPKFEGIYSFADWNGKKLLGANNGLYVYKNGSVKKFESIELNRPVYFIEKDEIDDLWLGTNNGVYKFDNKKLVNYGVTKGLSGTETNRDAFLLDYDNAIWIGTNLGLSKFIKAFEKTNTVRPKIDLVGIDIDGNNHSLNNKIEVSYDENNFNFTFLGRTFIDEEKTSYKVKLDGFDKDWVEVPNSQNPYVRYTNLPYGSYKFNVKAVNALGIESELKKSNLIIIGKPFYYGWGFLIFVFSLFLGMIYFLFVFVQKHQYAGRLEKEVEERLTELNESETKYKSLVTHLQEGLFVNVNFKVKYINNYLLDLTGYTEEEIIDRDFRDIIYYEDLKKVEANYPKRIRGEKFESNYNIRLVHKNQKDILTIAVNVCRIEYNGQKAIMGSVVDITDRLKKEERIRKLSTAVEQSQVLVTITDTAGTIEFVNQKYTEITGFSQNEVIGKKTTDFQLNENLTHIVEDIGQTLEAGGVWKGEYQIQSKFGEQINISAVISPIKNEDGEITNFIALEEDITYKKKAEEEIKTTKRILDSVLDNIPIVFFSVNENGVINLVRGKALESLGMNANTLLYKNVKSAFKEFREISNAIDKAMDGGAFSSIVPIENKYLEMFFAPIYGDLGRFKGFLTLSVDVTERYSAQISIKQSEEQNRAIINSMPDFLMELDSDGNYINCHNIENTSLVFSKDEIEGKNIREILSEENAQQILDGIKETLYSKEVKIIEFSLDVDGLETFLESRIISNGNNKVLVVFRNITDRRITEKALLKAKNEAEKSNRLKSEFLAQMSHEIRTPINSILSFTSLIKMEVEDQISEDIQIGFDAIERGSKRLIRTIDLILNMSQVQSGTYDPAFSNINLRYDVLEEVVQDLYSRAKAKNLKLKIKYETETEVIVADKYTLQQIFVNLIDNAIKYTNEGSIKVYVVREDDILKVKIIDTGIGITKEYIPTLFEPFTQEEMGYTRKYEGNGLGLALVKSYAEINNAYIEVDSRKNEGTTFTVNFNL